MQAEEPVMVTLAELSRLKGVSKPAITKRVRRLEADGLIVVVADGHNKRVDLAAYDLAIGKTGSPAHEQAAETAKAARQANPPKPELSSAFRDAQTAKALANARRAQLDVSERLGNLAPIKGPGGVEEAMIGIGHALVRAVDRMTGYSVEIASAAREGGEQAVRRVLRAMRDDLRRSMADALAPMVEDGKAIEAAGGVETDLDE